MKIDLPMMYNIRKVLNWMWDVSLPPQFMSQSVKIFDEQDWIAKCGTHLRGTYSISITPSCAATDDQIHDALRQLCEYIVSDHQESHGEVTWEELTATHPVSENQTDHPA
ncbi:MAG: hypothetical protein AAF702_44430 [Chloroflexota bacterium]